MEMSFRRAMEIRAERSVNRLEIYRKACPPFVVLADISQECARIRGSYLKASLNIDMRYFHVVKNRGRRNHGGEREWKMAETERPFLHFVYNAGIQLAA